MHGVAVHGLALPPARIATHAHDLLHPGRNKRWPEAFEPTGGELRVASWNLHKCVGTDGVFDPTRSIAVIAELNADVMALHQALNPGAR